MLMNTRLFLRLHARHCATSATGLGYRVAIADAGGYVHSHQDLDSAEKTLRAYIEETSPGIDTSQLSTAMRLNFNRVIVGNFGCAIVSR